MSSDSFQVPVIQTNYAKILVEIFSEYGFDVHKLLNESGLPADLFQSNSDFVPSDSIKRLIYLTSSQLKISNFVELLRLALQQRIIPHILHQFAEYDTIGAALKDVNRIFVNDTPSSRVHFRQEHGMSWFCVDSPHKEGLYPEWTKLFPIVYIQELMKLLTNSDWQFESVKLQNTDIDIIQSALPKSCQVFVGHEYTAVLIPQSLLDKEIHLPKSALSPKPAIVEWHTSFTDSVFEVLKPYVKERNLTIEDAAELLNFSVRTLQRKLKNEQSSFRKIKENLMFSVACELMEEGHSLTYISSQLGYNNISHFSRAFKRVSGLTPRLYQKSIT
ncbi:helix-turn-helix domain-containing protein [Vibrio paucivorans]